MHGMMSEGPDLGAVGWCGPTLPLCCGLWKADSSLPWRRQGPILFPGQSSPWDGSNPSPQAGAASQVQAGASDGRACPLDFSPGPDLLPLQTSFVSLLRADLRFRAGFREPDPQRCLPRPHTTVRAFHQGLCRGGVCPALGLQRCMEAVHSLIWVGPPMTTGRRAQRSEREVCTKALGHTGQRPLSCWWWVSPGECVSRRGGSAEPGLEGQRGMLLGR